MSREIEMPVPTSHLSETVVATVQQYQGYYDTSCADSLKQYL